MKNTVADSLELIKRAEASTNNNPDSVYCELIIEKIIILKQGLSDEFAVSFDKLPVHYSTEQLVGRAESSYEDLEIAVGLGGNLFGKNPCFVFEAGIFRIDIYAYLTDNV